MFTDMTEALEAEALELTPVGGDQRAAASLVTARRARSKDDLAHLLDALGLPCTEDDLIPLLPHLTTPEDTMTATNAFTATAASMLNNGDSPDHVRETLGLSENELAEALHHADHAASPTEPAHTEPPESGDPADDDGIEGLLAWAADHAAAAIRNKAARIRSDIHELTGRRRADDAQHKAEQDIARLKAELEQAQETLRAVKAGGRIPAPAAPLATRPQRTKEELATIRQWGRTNGFQIADRGTPAKVVLDAYDAAHRPTTLAEAS